MQRWLGVGTCLTLYGGYRHGPQGRTPALPVPRDSLDPGLRVPGVATAEASQAESQQEKEAALRGQGVARHHRLSAWGQLHLERVLSAPGVKHIWAGRLHLRPEPMSAFPSTLWSVWQNQGVPWPHVLAPQAQPDSSIHAWEVPGTRCPARG